MEKLKLKKVDEIIDDTEFFQDDDFRFMDEDELTESDAQTDVKDSFDYEIEHSDNGQDRKNEYKEFSKILLDQIQINLNLIKTICSYEKSKQAADCIEDTAQFISDVKRYVDKI